MINRRTDIGPSPAPDARPRQRTAPVQGAVTSASDTVDLRARVAAPSPLAPPAGRPAVVNPLFNAMGTVSDRAATDATLRRTPNPGAWMIASDVDAPTGKNIPGLALMGALVMAAGVLMAPMGHAHASEVKTQASVSQVTPANAGPSDQMGRASNPNGALGNSPKVQGCSTDGGMLLPSPGGTFDLGGGVTVNDHSQHDASGLLTQADYSLEGKQESGWLVFTESANLRTPQQGALSGKVAVDGRQEGPAGLTLTAHAEVSGGTDRTTDGRGSVALDGKQEAPGGLTFTQHAEATLALEQPMDAKGSLAVDGKQEAPGGLTFTQHAEATFSQGQPMNTKGNLAVDGKQDAPAGLTFTEHAEATFLQGQPMDAKGKLAVDGKQDAPAGLTFTEHAEATFAQAQPTDSKASLTVEGQQSVSEFLNLTEHASIESSNGQVTAESASVSAEAKREIAPGIVVNSSMLASSTQGQPVTTQASVKVESHQQYANGLRADSYVSANYTPAESLKAEAGVGLTYEGDISDTHVTGSAQIVAQTGHKPRFLGDVSASRYGSDLQSTLHVERNPETGTNTLQVGMNGTF